MPDQGNNQPRKTLSLGGKKINTDSGTLLQKSLRNVNRHILDRKVESEDDATQDRIKLLERHENEKNKKIEQFDASRVKIDVTNVPDIPKEIDSVAEKIEKYQHNKSQNIVKSDNRGNNKIDNHDVRHKSSSKKNKKRNVLSPLVYPKNLSNTTKYAIECSDDEYNVAEYEELYGMNLVISPAKKNTFTQTPVKKQRKSKNGRSDYAMSTKSELDIVISGSMSVKDFAELIGIKVGDVIKKCMQNKLTVTANQILDPDVMELIAMEYGHVLKYDNKCKYRQILEKRYFEHEDYSERSPIVAIMGHVDHGKTSLLDSIRKSDIASREHGGITQGICAYKITTKNNKSITFIDTPGHEIFSEMRSTGAKVTDIVILVVAADDGIMPQTIESIKQAQISNVPIIIAVNKMDKPGANPKRIAESLMQYNIIPEEYGGNTMIVPVSALTGDGVDKLIEAVLLQAEMMELKSINIDVADGVVIESRIDKNRGIVSTVIVKNGILKQGDIVVADTSFGKARIILNDKGDRVTVAGSSDPIEIFGLDGCPSIGECFYAVKTEKEANELVQEKKQSNMIKNVVVEKNTKIDAENIFADAKIENKKKYLNLIVRADTQGSLEAIKKIIERIKCDVVVRILFAGLGSVTDSDVTLAKNLSGNKVVIAAFNIKIDSRVIKLAEINNINIVQNNIIYHFEDAIKLLASDLLSPIRKEETIGTATVKQIFVTSKNSKIAGCIVTSGKIKRGANAKVIRNGLVVYDNLVESLRHFKDEVKEVASGKECGIWLANYDDIDIGDKIEVYSVTEEKRFID